MEEEDEARQLLGQQRYREAGRLLDRLLARDRENEDLLYLRGMVSLKMKNYDAAMEYFERAIIRKKKSRYYQIKGMAHFEMFEMDEAIDMFLAALRLDPKDVVTHFFLGMCYMLMDDPRSAEHVRKSHDLDPKRTKQFLTNFYSLFLQKDPRLSEAQKKKIEQRIKNIK